MRMVGGDCVATLFPQVTMPARRDESPQQPRCCHDTPHVDQGPEAHDSSACTFSRHDSVGSRPPCSEGGHRGVRRVSMSGDQALRFTEEVLRRLGGTFRGNSSSCTELQALTRGLLNRAGFARKPPQDGEQPESEVGEAVSCGATSQDKHEPPRHEEDRKIPFIDNLPTEVSGSGHVDEEATSPLPVAPSASTATVLKKIQKWGDYASFGRVVGTRVIPMKTPLTQELQKGYLRKGRADPAGSCGNFTLRGFLEAQAALGRRVGMIVDLSNHDCLYQEDIPTEGLQYKHFSFVAKRLPDQEGCRKVARAITEFIADHPDEYVAIHCSYGLNRTGFVVCSYLVEELGYEVGDAVAAFRAARPPGIRHTDFIEELRARYADYHSKGRGNTCASALRGDEVQGRGAPLDGISAGEGSTCTENLGHADKDDQPAEDSNAEVNNDSLGELSGKKVLEELAAHQRASGDPQCHLQDGQTSPCIPI